MPAAKKQQHRRHDDQAFPDIFLTLLEVAHRLRLGEIRRPREGQPATASEDERRVRAARYLVKSGRLNAVMIGGRLLVSSRDLAEFEASALLSGRSPSAASPVGKPAPSASPPPDNPNSVSTKDVPSDHSGAQASAIDHSGGLS